jgi:menaquinone-dependent protoporphyrinogen oxidase
MTTRVLVAYGTKYGATAEIAEKIGQVLREAGLAVDVRRANQAGDPAAYQAVVLGSAVYIGKWRKEAVKFLQDNEQALARLPVWIFNSGPLGEGDAAELAGEYGFPKGLRPITDRIRPRDIVIFHGAIDLQKLNRLDRWMFRNVSSTVGDFRNWDAIAAWASRIAAALQEPQVVMAGVA